VRLGLSRSKLHADRCADAVVLNCESFTTCPHLHVDNNSFHRVALSSSPAQLIASVPLDLLIE
jgi:hypothetical protein